MDVLDAILKVSQAGSTVLLLFAVVGAAKGYWVPRWIFDESVKRESAWQALYEREKATSEQLLAQAERARGVS